MKYSRGPWVLNERGRLWIHRPDTFAVARVCASPYHFSREEVIGNANLIVAAPTMFEALKQIADNECNCCAGDCGCGGKLERIATEALKWSR